MDDVRAPRVFAGGLATETNVFSPLVTGLRDFAISSPQDDADRRSRLLGGSVFARFADVCATHQCRYIQGTFASATAAGPTTTAAYEELRNQLLQEIREAMPLHGVLLALHGAMVAVGYDDCEEDLLAAVRAEVGDETTIGVLFDLHCDLSDQLLELANIIVTFKEYPHVDVDQRATELAELTVATINGTVVPVSEVFDCRVVGLFPTTSEPMRTFVNRLQAAERAPDVLSVSLGHGFPWGDAPANRARLLVVSDNSRDQARGLAETLGREFFELRKEVSLNALSLDDALQELDHLIDRGERPVVIAEVSDNPGLGAAGDATHLLAAVIGRQGTSAAVALLWDPAVVSRAFVAGEGASLEVRLGGKSGRPSGEPLDLTVSVTKLVPDLIQQLPQHDGVVSIPTGECARLTCENVDIIVSSTRQQVYGTEVFTAFGIDPLERDVIVVKSTSHFRAAFDPLAAAVLLSTTPGALSFDPTQIPYSRMDKCSYPWTDDPFGDRSEASPSSSTTGSSITQ